MRRFLAPVAAVFAAAIVAVAGAGPAWACGGLVAPNGTVRLLRTSTLAAWHAGVEHYVTSFQFSGEGSEFGSIVPLPAIPTSVVRGGDWTLQRLEREVAPPVKAFAASAAAGSGAAGGAQVVLQTRIDALDITVLKGGGREVGDWARQHGYLLTPDAPEILDFYARRSPIFLAARFDAAAARGRGQRTGDGTPVHITMPLSRPWVPLRILTLGRGPLEPVPADVFLLTDKRISVHLPSEGADVERSDPASPLLLSDLRSDKGMEWVPASMWFTYVRIQGPGRALRSDITTTALRTPAPETVTTTATTVPPTTTASTEPVPPLPDVAAPPLAPASHHRSMPVALLVLAVGLPAAAVAAGAALFRPWRLFRR
jgi:hypothetical protein